MDRQGIVLLQQWAGLRLRPLQRPACCIARTLERKALGAVPTPVNQKDRKHNINGVTWESVRSFNYQPLLSPHNFSIGFLINKRYGAISVAPCVLR